MRSLIALAVSAAFAVTAVAQDKPAPPRGRPRNP